MVRDRMKITLMSHLASFLGVGQGELLSPDQHLGTRLCHIVPEAAEQSTKWSHDLNEPAGSPTIN